MRAEIGDLHRAIRLATRLHLGQVDKVQQPYIGHPLRVMAYAADMGLDEDHLKVAVLHDVVEDCDITVEELFDLFGGRIARAVDAISKRKDESYQQYIRRCAQNRIARVVKRLDIRDNSDPARKWAGTERALREKYPWAISVLEGNDEATED